MIHFVSLNSSYQYGPDTYLLQVKDPDFPARLREYLNVAKLTSAEFQDVKVQFKSNCPQICLKLSGK